MWPKLHEIPLEKRDEVLEEGEVFWRPIDLDEDQRELIEDWDCEENKYYSGDFEYQPLLAFECPVVKNSLTVRSIVTMLSLSMIQRTMFIENFRRNCLIYSGPIYENVGSKGKQKLCISMMRMMKSA